MGRPAAQLGPLDGVKHCQVKEPQIACAHTAGVEGLTRPLMLPRPLTLPRPLSCA
jgi:hypothetical protein